MNSSPLISSQIDDLINEERGQETHLQAGINNIKDQTNKLTLTKGGLGCDSLDSPDEDQRLRGGGGTRRRGWLLYWTFVFVLDPTGSLFTLRCPQC